MQIQGPSFVHGPQSIAAPHRSVRSAAGQSAAAGGVDELSISPQAQAASESRGTEEVRWDRVAELKAQIASGEYETDEKLSAAVGNLLDALG